MASSWASAMTWLACAPPPPRAMPSRIASETSRCWVPSWCLLLQAAPLRSPASTTPARSGPGVPPGIPAPRRPRPSSARAALASSAPTAAVSHGAATSSAIPAAGQVARPSGWRSKGGSSLVAAPTCRAGAGSPQAASMRRRTPARKGCPPATSRRRRSDIASAGGSQQVVTELAPSGPRAGRRDDPPSAQPVGYDRLRRYQHPGGGPQPVAVDPGEQWHREEHLLLGREQTTNQAWPRRPRPPGVAGQAAPGSPPVRYRARLQVRGDHGTRRYDRLGAPCGRTEEGQGVHATRAGEARRFSWVHDRAGGAKLHPGFGLLGHCVRPPGCAILASAAWACWVPEPTGPAREFRTELIPR